MMLQLVLLLLFVMTIPVVILIGYSGTQIIRFAENAIAKHALAELDATAQLTENTLEYAANDVVRLLVTNLFDDFKDTKNFHELTKDYEKGAYTQRMMFELRNLVWRFQETDSAFFYLNGADYVVSSGSGLTLLKEYESIDWLEQALAQKVGISGVWYPHKNDAGVYQLSYVIPLNRFSGSTKGTIVLNFSQEKLSRLISPKATQEYVFLQENGTVVCSSNRELLLKNELDKPYMRDILLRKETSGYMFRTEAGERNLYTWVKSPGGWYFVNTYPTRLLIEPAYEILRNIAVLAALIMVLGGGITILLAKRFSDPIRRLTQRLRGGETAQENRKNELLILDEEFHKIKKEEARLSQQLRDREDQVREHAVRLLLHGEEIDQQNSHLLQKVFYRPFYLVVFITIDGYNHYSSVTSTQMRRYHRYRFIALGAERFADAFCTTAVYEQEGCIAFVLNYDPKDVPEIYGTVYQAVESLQQAALGVFEQTVTVGVSSAVENTALLPECLSQARLSARERMLKGCGAIYLWRDKQPYPKQYFYPVNSERRILNYLEIADLKSITQALDELELQLLNTPSVSAENVLFLYHQLTGAVIRYLSEHNVNLNRIFADNLNLYAAISRQETVQEINRYMQQFFAEIVQYLRRDVTDDSLVLGVLAFVDKHFTEDLAFESIALEMGISYSYLRKILREKTGKSLLDQINERRIRQAKHMLMDGRMTIAEIAQAVGYHNVQSLNRFFRKYEGMAPGEYRSARQQTTP